MRESVLNNKPVFRKGYYTVNLCIRKVTKQ